jgi:ABC-type nitrate/sulfonate/bicarbonate transport system substrate-binding protein
MTPAKLFCSLQGTGRLKKIAMRLASLFLGIAVYSASSAADKLRIGYASPSVNVALLWVTHEAKLFAKNGLDVEVLFLESALVQRSMISSEIQLAMMTGGLMAAPRLAGADLTMIAGFINRYVSRVMVRPEIIKPADLKGKRAGIVRLGAAADRGLRLVLSRWGLNPDKDLIFLQVPGGEPARIAALAANSIDVSLINPPYHKKGIEAGLKVLANMEDMDIPIQHIGLVTTQRLIAKAPDVVRRTVKSYVEGIQVMRIDPKLAKAALGKYMRITEESELEETYQLLKKLVPAKPYPTLEGFRIVLDELSDKIPAAKTANPKDFTDTRFLDELDRSGFFDQISK